MVDEDEWLKSFADWISRYERAERAVPSAFRTRSRRRRAGSRRNKKLRNVGTQRLDRVQRPRSSRHHVAA